MSEITIRPKKAVVVLGLVLALITLLHLLSYIPLLTGAREHPVLLLNMDAEESLPALFSTFLLGLSAFLTAAIAWGHKERALRVKWAVLAVCFFMMAMDESIAVHERIGGVMDRLAPWLGMHTFAWMLPYAVLVLIFVVIYARFWWNLPSDTRFLVGLGGGIFVCGALGFEMIGAYLSKQHMLGLIYFVEVTLEEMLEFVGGILLVYAFLLHIDRHLPGLVFRISSTEDA